MRSARGAQRSLEQRLFAVHTRHQLVAAGALDQVPQRLHMTADTVVPSASAAAFAAGHKSSSTRTLRIVLATSAAPFAAATLPAVVQLARRLVVGLGGGAAFLVEEDV